MLKTFFTRHPASVGETYFQHLGVALSFSFAMMSGGLACLVHAFFPFLFERTGSRRIATLHDRMIVNRDYRSNDPVNRSPLQVVPASDNAA